MQTWSKHKCYDAIAKASYQGTKSNSGLSSYVAIHREAHQDLIHLGESISENKKG
jgi:hypothetical protein